MAAHAKLTYGGENRLLMLLVFGEPLEAACRAVRVSSTAVRKKAARDPAFAHRLKVAQENQPPTLGPVEPPDWGEIAAQLERENRELWALPDLGLEE
jgi:hypothetical protein